MGHFIEMKGLANTIFLRKLFDLFLPLPASVSISRLFRFKLDPQKTEYKLICTFQNYMARR